jgi:O-antigen/teichoic acid export membrane protein
MEKAFMSPSHLAPDAETKVNVARTQIRGSSLLLSGRGLAIGAKLISQTLMVRYLSTSDYGAWAYALALVSLLGSFAGLSLDRAVSRFAAIYHQQQQYDKFFGVLLLVIGTVLATGFVFATILYLFPEQIESLTGVEKQPLMLLFILVFLVPLGALDDLCTKIFATFGRAGAIFFRRYVLAPSLQLGVVLLLVLQGASVSFLAGGWLVASLLGLAINGGLLWRVLREQGLFQSFNLRKIVVPAREVFSFTAPLLTSDWLTALGSSSGILLLGYFYDTEQVAMLNAVIPIAGLNLLVIQSFEFLFVPAASRMFATADLEGINHLYWRTGVWMAVLSFPVVAVTFLLATPLTVLLFGDRYAQSGAILAAMALGNYFQASLGLNGTTLKVLGKVRYVVVINALAAITNIVLALVLIPPFGALGAAYAITATLIIHNLFKQAGLRLAAGFSLVDHNYFRPYTIIAAGLVTLMVAQMLGPDNLVFLAVVTGLVSLTVLILTKRTLGIDDTFPEVMKIPFLRVILK